MIIHSFDGVLRAPRSAHSIEIIPGRRIPLPRPVPWISVVYFVVVFFLIAALDNVVSLVTIVGAPLDFVSGGSAYLAALACCYLFLPAGIVWLATNAEVDGRSPHRWIVSALRYAKRPKRTIAGRPVRREGTKIVYRGRVRVWWDIDAPRLHHGWVTGGRISARVPVRFTSAIRHTSPVVEPHDDGVLLTDYDVDNRLEVRP